MKIIQSVLVITYINNDKVTVQNVDSIEMTLDFQSRTTVCPKILSQVLRWLTEFHVRVITKELHQ